MMDRFLNLNQNGISGSLDYSSIESDVPQGSVLGPLLFLVYINDLERNIKSKIKFSADHTKLFSIVKDPVTSANDLNQNLAMIYQCAHEWKMEFNSDPIKQATEVLFYLRKIVVVKVNEQKHLGLTFEPGLSFEKHLSEKIKG